MRRSKKSFKIIVCQSLLLILLYVLQLTSVIELTYESNHCVVKEKLKFPVRIYINVPSESGFLVASMFRVIS